MNQRGRGIDYIKPEVSPEVRGSEFLDTSLFLFLLSTILHFDELSHSAGDLRLTLLTPETSVAMTTYQRPSSYAALKGKTILLTGCATGLGRETAILAHSVFTNPHPWSGCACGPGVLLIMGVVYRKRRQSRLGRLERERYTVTYLGAGHRSGVNCATQFIDIKVWTTLNF